MATVARSPGAVVRTAVALAGVALLLTVAPAAAGLGLARGAVGYDAAATARLYSLVNAHRAAIGLRALTVHAPLATIARGHTARMAAIDDCVHNDALFTRAAHTALRIATFGENVALNDTLDGAHAALLTSPPHRANIENAAFAVAGFAVVVDAKGLVWVTQDFGTPPRAAAPVAAPRVLPAPRAVTPPVARTPVAPRARTATRAAARPAARPVVPTAARPPAKATVAARAPARPAARKDGGAGRLDPAGTAAAAPVAAAPGSVAAPGPAAPGGPRRATWPAALAVALLVLAGLGLVAAPRRAVAARLGA